MSVDYRSGLADAVVKIAFARFWPHVRADDLADIVGITQREWKDAVNRARGIKPITPPLQKPSRSKKPVGPPGTKWCVRGERDENGNFQGHHVKHELFGVNRSRNDGFSDFCKACWRDYWRERRARQ